LDFKNLYGLKGKLQGKSSHKKVYLQKLYCRKAYKKRIFEILYWKVWIL